MQKPKLKLIEESIKFVDDVEKLRNTIIHLIEYIRWKEVNK